MKRSILTLLILGGAIWAPLSHAGDEFTGLIESRPEGKVGTWVIGGRHVAVLEQTQVKEEHGPLVVGACAEVEYQGDVVEEVESEEKSECMK